MVVGVRRWFSQGICRRIRSKEFGDSWSAWVLDGFENVQTLLPSPYSSNTVTQHSRPLNATTSVLSLLRNFSLNEPIHRQSTSPRSPDPSIEPCLLPLTTRDYPQHPRSNTVTAFPCPHLRNHKLLPLSRPPTGSQLTLQPHNPHQNYLHTSSVSLAVSVIDIRKGSQISIYRFLRRGVWVLLRV